jgi:TolB-like protein
MKGFLGKSFWFALLAFFSATMAVTSNNQVTQLRKRTPTLAVLPFEDTNVAARDKGYGASIAAILNTHLRNETNFIVMESSRLSQLFGEKNLGINGMSDAERLRLGQLFSVEVILTGEVADIGGVLHIDARLISVETGNVVVAEFVEIRNIIDLRQHLGDLVRGIELKYLREWIGSLTVSCMPVEGEVYLDDVYMGRSSQKKPLVVEKLLEGEYNLRVIAGGYEEYRNKVNIRSMANRDVGVMLQSLLGSLHVVSDPVGARVFIDDRDMGLAPLVLENMEKGAYRVSMQLDNYMPWNGSVAVEPGQTAELRTALLVIPGRLLVQSEPKGADVFMAGNRVGVTPLLVDNVRPGTYSIDLQLDQYFSKEALVSVLPGQEYVLNHTFERETGTLTMLAQVEGANVQVFSIGNRKLSEWRMHAPIFDHGLPVHNHLLETGQYMIVVQKKGYHTLEEHLVLEPQQELRREFTLKKKPGRIVVTGNVILGASYYLNGVYEGGKNVFELPEGSYSVTRKTFFDQQQVDVEVQADQTTSISFESVDSGASKWVIPASILGLIMIFFVGRN